MISVVGGLLAASPMRSILQRLRSWVPGTAALRALAEDDEPKR